LLLSAVASFKSGMSADLNPSVNRHMKRVIQPTFESDNGEAYFSFASNKDDWHENLKKFGYNFELYLIKSDGSDIRKSSFVNIRFFGGDHD